MRPAPIFGLLTAAILVTALIGEFGAEDQPVAAAYETPRSQVSSSTTTEPRPTTTNQTAPTTTTTPPLERKPDVDAVGGPVGDLLAGTTPPAEASAPALGVGPAPPTTQPRAVGTPAPAPAPTTAPTTAPAPSVQAGPNGELEAQFAANINGLRSGNGLAGLSRDGSLDSKARSWAESMAANGGLSHSNLGLLLPPWSAAAENVAMGGSVDSVFGSLAGSGGHKSNMLGDYTHLGVGVWVDSSGLIWTAHIFTR